MIQTHFDIIYWDRGMGKEIEDFVWSGNLNWVDWKFLNIKISFMIR